MSAETAEVDVAVGSLMREAAWWRLTSLLFERPHGDWWREVHALAAEVEDEDLVEAAKHASDATEGEYLATLGPSGKVSVREAGHDGRRDPGHVLAELSAYYDAFAYGPRTENPDDHVSVETGFVGYLYLKQAYALATRGNEEAGLAAAAARAFVKDHLTSLAQPLADTLATAGAGHLAAAARALARRVGPAPAAPGPKVFWMEEDSTTCAGGQ